MTNLPPGMFLISSQYGDLESAGVLRPHFQGLKAAFRNVPPAAPCQGINQLAYVLRVSGSIARFEFVGCDKIELNRKEKYISIDVGVPIDFWKDRSDREISEYLIVSMRQGLEQMLARLQLQKIACEGSPIRTMFEVCAQRYLEAW